MPNPSSVRATFVALVCLAAQACSYVDAPAHPRPALAVPEAVAKRFELPGPVELLALDRLGDGSTLSGDLGCGPETVHFTLHLAERTDAPLVLLVPILGGGDELLRTMARRFVERGYHAVHCARVGSALRPPQRGPDLEAMIVRTVLHQRAVLTWLESCREVRPRAIFACGASMGGIVTTLLAAIEPRLSGAAMCLAGADLPAILADSTEPRVVRWREWRREADGIAGAPLEQELRANLRSDPLRFAAYVPTDRVFLVSATLDDVVRKSHQDLLWEALGRPQRVAVPLGHYTTALALDPLMSSIADFFDARQQRADPALAGPPPLP